MKHWSSRAKSSFFTFFFCFTPVFGHPFPESVRVTLLYLAELSVGIPCFASLLSFLFGRLSSILFCLIPPCWSGPLINKWDGQIVFLSAVLFCLCWLDSRQLLCANIFLVFRYRECGRDVARCLFS
jgi:hypothetical protein